MLLIVQQYYAEANTESFEFHLLPLLAFPVNTMH